MRKSLNSRRLNNCNLLFAARLEICEIVSIRPLFSLFLYLCVSMSCVRFHPLNLLIVAANHRSNHCLPTITTIGHKQAELHRIIGCNLVQRESALALCDDCVVTIILNYALHMITAGLFLHRSQCIFVFGLNDIHTQPYCSI